MTQQIPDGAVIITPAAMYAEQRKTHEAVLELASAVRSVGDNVRQDRVDNAKSIADHEARIRVVEQRKFVPPSVVWTAIALAVAAIGALAAVLGLR